MTTSPDGAVGRLSLRGLLWPARGRLAQVLSWSLVLAGATAAYGALAGPLLRALFGGEALAWPAWLAPHLPPPPSVSTLRRVTPALVLGAAVVKGVAQHRHAVAMARLGQGVVADLRRRLHARVLALPPDAVTALGAGDLLARGTGDAEAAERLVSQGVAGAARDLLQVVALLAVCVAVDPWLALVAFGVYPVAFWPVARFARRLRRSAGTAHAERGRLTTELHEQLRRLPLIQLSGAEAGAAARGAARVHAAVDAAVRTARVRAIASPFTEVLGAVALAGTLAFAVRRIDAGALAAEHVLSFVAALLLLYQPVKGLVRAQEVLQPGRAALDRVDAVLAAPDRLPVGGGAAPPKAAPRLRLRGVTVERGGRRVLDGVDADVPAEAVTALLGPNGAGKTTLAWVLARLVEPSAGGVHVDDLPLAALDAAAWRGRVGWVPQTPLLGRGTLRENVLFGAPAGADARLDDAAREVGLDKVVEDLPQGWATPLGDDGAGLSGGERQRVALARALVRAPRLLVLDEPDAHLDAAGRDAMRGLVRRLARGRTVLLVTHDPTLAAVADHVIHLAGGRRVATEAAA